MSSITIKATLNGEMRRLTTSATDLEQLRQLLSGRFEIPAETFALKWIDEDGDAVTIATQEDYTEAITSSGDKLRLLLTSTSTPAAQPAQPAAQPTEAPQAACKDPSEDLKKAFGAFKASPLGGMLGGVFAQVAEHVKHGVQEAAAQAKKAQEEAEKNVKNGTCQAIHFGVTCDVSGMNPIRGVRYHKKGEDYDLCEAEYLKLSDEDKTAFEAIEKPTFPPGFPFQAGTHHEHPFPAGLFQAQQEGCHGMQGGMQGFFQQMQKMQEAMKEAAEKAKEAAEKAAVEQAAQLDKGAPCPAMDSWVDQAAASFRTGGSVDDVVDRFVLSRGEGDTWVTNGDRSGRHIFRREGNMLHHLLCPLISATLGEDGDLCWSHGFTSRLVENADEQHAAEAKSETSEAPAEAPEECKEAVEEAVACSVEEALSQLQCGDLSASVMADIAQAVEDNAAAEMEAKNAAEAEAKAAAEAQAAAEAEAKAAAVAQAKAEAEAEAARIAAEARIAEEARIAAEAAAAAEAEAEAQAQAEAERIEAERIEAERVEAERIEAERMEAEAKAEADAEAAARALEAEERAAMLVDMGFAETDVASALDATQGSLERAADWLFVHATPKGEAEAEAEAPEETFPEVPTFPAEWAGPLRDLQEMGFSEEQGMDALRTADGDLKGAVRVLVSRERSNPVPPA